MTASITIVNTSNWDGENFRITRKHGGESHVLKPGESTELHPEHGSDDPVDVQAQPEFDKETRPIYAPGVTGRTRHNEQVFPKVRVTFEG